MNILGISALYHDSAACLVMDGDIVAAAQEERFSRIKHDLNMPIAAIKYCLEEGGITADDLDYVVFYDDPVLTLDRYMKNIIAAGSDSRDVIERSYNSMFGKKLWINNVIKNILGSNIKVLVCEHHISHAASAFYPSPFEDAIIITLDGLGEWTTTTIGIGHGNNIEIKKELRFPHSLGLFYSAFTYFCGFKVNSGDYKFMGLAPYGEPIYVELIKDKIINIKDDGSFRLNLDYFDFQYGRTMTNDKFAELFGSARREPETKITKREMDIAASVQLITEEIILRIVRSSKKVYGKEINNLVLAGGCALNCVANGKIYREKIFENIWVQPAAGDAGGALGAALYATYTLSGAKRECKVNDSQKGSLLGPSFSNEYIANFLDSNKYPYHFFENEEIYDRVTNELVNEKIVGLLQGRMEYGPRALGARSIVADPRSEKMQSRLNLKIKYRESFRPFAPAVLREDVNKYFNFNDSSPYMLMVENVKDELCIKKDIQHELLRHDENMIKIVNQKRSIIPAVTHVDYSARIQTVDEDKNPYFYKLLRNFKNKTGCAVLVNTSFNVRGEPIVMSPEDAYRCFMRTDMDILVLENFLLYKEEQPDWEDNLNWRDEYQLD